MIYYYCKTCQDYTPETCQVCGEKQVERHVDNVAVEYHDGSILPVDELYNPFFDDLPSTLANALPRREWARTVCSECHKPLDSIFTCEDTVAGLEQMLRDSIESHHDHSDDEEAANE